MATGMKELDNQPVFKKQVKIKAPLQVFILLAFIVTYGTGCLLPSAEKTLPERTALDDYVERPDDSFSWKIIKTSTSDKARTFVLDMNSQTWRTKDEVDRPVWQHWITVVVPEKVKSNIGFMFIGGGGNGGNPPEGPDEKIQKIALATQTVVAQIHMIPNQPLVFHNDGERRTEDDLVAYTWVKFLETGDAIWPARNPMVKSVVRAMDAVTELLASEEGGSQPIDQYVVAGGSKRGWTTWLVGAVDKRVVGIAPIVIDILNLEKSMGHHFSAYGFYAPSIADYVEHKLVQMPDHPRMGELFALVDPYHYRHRLTMPKYVLNGSGDQFFPPDMSRHYFDDLQGEKYLRYVPNADHGLGGSDAVESLVAFYSLILEGKEGPDFSWNRSSENAFRVKTVDKPQKVVLWKATNPEARDFRLESLGPKYESQVLEDEGDGTYLAEVEKPEKGWTAFFVELTYDVGAPTPLKVTTNIGIVPDVFPFADKDATLPTSFTLRFQAPSEDVAEQIQEKLGSDEMKAFVEDPRISSPGNAPKEGISFTLNWIPKGRFDKSARAVADYLETLGCGKFVFQMESGRPASL
jgi:PhoPQ-activated pathogenicity-related protein